MKDIEALATIESIVVKSDCGNHRFVLGRIWDRSLPVNAFLCANPSKADELRYDSTVFKCGNMAANWSWGGFYILNLYPNYSTDPKMVVRDSEADRINEKHVSRIIQDADVVVVACGNGHANRLEQLIRNVPKGKFYCLRPNKGGGFLHPSREDPDSFEKPERMFANEA